MWKCKFCESTNADNLLNCKVCGQSHTATPPSTAVEAETTATMPKAETPGDVRVGHKPSPPPRTKTNWSWIVWAIGIFVVGCFAFVVLSGILVSASRNNPSTDVGIQDEPVSNEIPTSQPLVPTTAPSRAPTRVPTTVPTQQNIPTRAEPYTGTATISNEVYKVNLRKTPGYITKKPSDVIVEIPTGSILNLIRGPEEADGLQWWYIEWRGYKGWVAETTGSGKTILIFD